MLLKFLKQHHDGRSPLLLALSGGSDSLALWQMLKEAQAIHPFALHVAHVDHGWRPESRGQAEDLRKLVGEPFHTIRLEGVTSENEARDKRFGFFQELQEEWGFQAVLLAHHADDQSETVLKRVLEGAHMAHLGGMTAISQKGSLNCWRPLLKYTKKEIASVLKHAPFPDSTNTDVSFLRNRMRLEMLPFLEQSFGKNVNPNLARLGERAQKMKEYFEYRLKAYAERVIVSPLGILWDFAGLPLETSLEWEWLIKKKFPQVTGIERIMDALIRGVADYQIDEHFFVDRYRLFWLEEKRPSWQAEIFHIPGSERLGWKSAWSGDVRVFVPSEQFTLVQAEPSMQLAFSPKKLGSLWSEYKVPAFLRSRVPVIQGKEGVWAEFLTGISYKRGSVHLQVKLI